MKKSLLIPFLCLLTHLNYTTSNAATLNVSCDYPQYCFNISGDPAPTCPSPGSTTPCSIIGTIDDAHFQLNGCGFNFSGHSNTLNGGLIGFFVESPGTETTPESSLRVNSCQGILPCTGVTSTAIMTYHEAGYESWTGNCSLTESGAEIRNP